MNQSNCIVAQSGGPTVAINASLAGVIAGVKSSEKYDICYGAVNGILGILNENYLNLSDIFADDANLEKLKTTPAMYLGSCRHKLPDYKDDDSPYVYIFHQFDKLSIKAFFYIGGNDSMDTVLKLSDYAKKINSDVKIIGIPKTIDNDLCMTDHTPGFGSAAKYIASSMLEIAHDTFIYAVKSVTIVEIMGRDAGWLTAASALARNEYNTAPQFIYLPEVDFDKDKFVADIKEALTHTNNVIVAVSEGIHDADGSYITSSKAACDQFGHQQLSGAGKALEFIVKENIGVKVRSVEVNVLQRCASHLASLTDIEESFAQGFHQFLEHYFMDKLAYYRMLAGIAHNIDTRQVSYRRKHGVRSVQQSHFPFVVRCFRRHKEHIQSGFVGREFGSYFLRCFNYPQMENFGLHHHVVIVLQFFLDSRNILARESRYDTVD